VSTGRRWLVGQAHLPALPANLASIAACSLANFLASEHIMFVSGNRMDSSGTL
jgi:hypothetical protein